MIRAVIFDMFETLIIHYRSPLCFGAQMAEDAEIPVDRFQALWRSTEYDRCLGRLSFEKALEAIFRENGCYSDSLLQEILARRMKTKEICFAHLHPEIVPLLAQLKKRGLLVGLISNCFSEEAEVIRKSRLYPYFDAALLSCE